MQTCKYARILHASLKLLPPSITLILFVLCINALLPRQFLGPLTILQHFLPVDPKCNRYETGSDGDETKKTARPRHTQRSVHRHNCKGQRSAQRLSSHGRRGVC